MDRGDLSQCSCTAGNSSRAHLFVRASGELYILATEGSFGRKHGFKERLINTKVEGRGLESGPSCTAGDLPAGPTALAHAIQPAWPPRPRPKKQL